MLARPEARPYLGVASWNAASSSNDPSLNPRHRAPSPRVDRSATILKNVILGRRKGLEMCGAFFKVDHRFFCFFFKIADL